MMDFEENGGPNGVLSKFHSIGIEGLDETVNFRVLNEGRMSSESGRKMGFRPELFEEREREEEKEKEKGKERERKGRERDMAGYLGEKEVYWGSSPWGLLWCITLTH